MKQTIVAVGLLSLILALANSLFFILGMIKTPPGTVFLGTIHYWEDYFLYLNHFFQGAHGNWLVANRYTSEATAPSILYWSNFLLGKIGGFLYLSPMVSYNLSVMLLSFVVLVISYLTLKKIFPTDRLRALTGFFIGATATSMINHIWVDGKPMWYPFQLWRTPHYAFDRLGGAPHQILQTLLFLFMTILYFHKESAKPKMVTLLSLLTIALATLNPIQAVIFFGAAWACTLIVPDLRKTHIPHLLLISIVALSSFLYTNSALSELPHLQSKLWEGAQQTTTTLPFLLLSVGPVSLLFFIGLLPSLRQKKPMLLFGIILVLGTYVLFLSGVPKLLGLSNVRVIFPALYPFIGAVGANGIFSLKSKRWVILCLVLFLLLSLPTMRVELKEKLAPLSQASDILIFLPKNIYQGFTQLSKLPLDAVTIGNPASHIDVLIPPLSGHTTYSGHPLATISNDKKREDALQFFRLQKPDASLWLEKNTIRFVLFTSYDGNKELFMKTYPFLLPLWANPDMTIFTQDLHS
ncbi:MAG: hypothetical protein AAB481_04730 [Patescibacteria group bacterium]